MKAKIDYETRRERNHTTGSPYSHDSNLFDEDGRNINSTGTRALLALEISAARIYHENTMQQNNKIQRMHTVIEVEL